MVICMCVPSYSAYASEFESQEKLSAEIDATPEYASLISYEADLLRQMQVLIETTETDRIPKSVDFPNLLRC